MRKSYKELIKIEDFADRVKYLSLNGRAFNSTFGDQRYLNQIFYQRSARWKQIRQHIILRDNGCDLAHPEFQICEPVYIHHINPVTPEDILNNSPILFDPNNLITTTYKTHQAIHYGHGIALFKEDVVRRPNDTCPWKE